MFQRSRVQTRRAALSSRTAQNGIDSENIVPGALLAGKEKIFTSKVGTVKNLGEQKNSILVNNISNGIKARTRLANTKSSNDENISIVVNIPTKAAKAKTQTNENGIQAKAGGKALTTKDSKLKKEEVVSKPVLRSQVNKVDPFAIRNQSSKAESTKLKAQVIKTDLPTSKSQVSKQVLKNIPTQTKKPDHSKSNIPTLIKSKATEKHEIVKETITTKRVSQKSTSHPTQPVLAQKPVQQEVFEKSTRATVVRVAAQRKVETKEAQLETKAAGSKVTRKHADVEEAPTSQALAQVAKKVKNDEVQQGQRVVTLKKQQLSGEAVTWDDLDAGDENDPMMVSEYVADIFDYMRVLELQTMPSATYMEGQPEITWKTRAIVIDWLADVHFRFRFVQETFFLAINILDRFLTLRQCSVRKLQLVSIASLFIAAKYEETYAPLVRHLLEAVDEEYTEESIVQAERYILQTINFSLQYPNPLNFLRRASKAERYDNQTRTLAKYLIEVAQTDYRCIQYPPSQISAAALNLARKMLVREEGWTPNLVHYSGYKLEEIEGVSNTILEGLYSQLGSYEAIRHKYNSKRFMKASTFVDEWLLDRGLVTKERFDELEEAYNQQDVQEEQQNGHS